MNTLTQRFHGRRVRQCETNGHLLAFRLEDNSVVQVAWVDDNGKPIKGRPVVESSGARLNARSLQEMIRMPKG